MKKSVGCDYVVTLNLTINNSSTGSQTLSRCGSYTWPANGQTYTTSGVRTATLTNSVGCDSVVTLNLTINQGTTGSQTVSSCNAYTWPANGQTYTTSGVRTATLTNSVGCDSVVTLNLTINQGTTGSQTVSSCNAYTWSANGQTYTTSGVRTATLTNSVGCDSVVTLNLTINATPVATISQAGTNLTASPAGASYQWIDCGNGDVAIPGATSQSFPITQNGNFAVIVTINGCSDTSACELVVGINEAVQTAIRLFPNPATDIVQIEASSPMVAIVLMDMTGKILRASTEPDSIEAEINIGQYASGMYLVKVQLATGELQTIRLVRQ